MKQQTKQGLQRESVFKKVLITGIDGFTGKYLEKFLISKGYDVYGTVFIDNILNGSITNPLGFPPADLESATCCAAI